MFAEVSGLANILYPFSDEISPHEPLVSSKRLTLLLSSPIVKRF